MTKLLANNTAMVLILAAVLVLISVLVLNRAYQSTMDETEWQEQIHQVQIGDTLWAVSRAYCPAHVDRREWVHEIQALNGLTDSTIHPGQEIIVLAPVRKEVTEK